MPPVAQCNLHYGSLIYVHQILGKILFSFWGCPLSVGFICAIWKYKWATYLLGILKYTSFQLAFDSVIVNRCLLAWKHSRIGSEMTWSAGEKQILQEAANTSKTWIVIWQLTLMSARGNLLRFFVFFIFGFIYSWTHKLARRRQIVRLVTKLCINFSS